jgi:hypothetical protein
MRRNLFLYLRVLLMLLGTTHRAPAPIVEESPTPAATATATAKPQPKATAEAAKAKPRPSAPKSKPKLTPVSFVGLWDTNFNNQLQVSQTGDQVIGMYDGGRGTLNGIITRNVVSGTWAWKNQRGVFRFLLSSDGNSFSGTFSGSSGVGGAWTGIRRRP